ncbi:MAG: hypothetical protein V2B18_03800, partial [Pseudomonadota bacterium]
VVHELARTGAVDYVMITPQVRRFTEDAVRAFVEKRTATAGTPNARRTNERARRPDPPKPHSTKGGRTPAAGGKALDEKLRSLFG